MLTELATVVVILSYSHDFILILTSFLINLSFFLVEISPVYLNMYLAKLNFYKENLENDSRCYLLLE